MRSASPFLILRPVTAGLLILQLALPAAGFVQAQKTDAPAAMQQAPANQAQDNQEPAMQVPANQDSGMQNPDMQDGSAGLQHRSSVMAAPPPSNLPLSKDAAILLSLSRFTYGPRPGDMERVRQIGLSEWFHQQLNPSLIDDSALQARLAAFPAMQMPLDRLMEMYPSNNLVRQSLNNRAAIPGGDAAHAIYMDQQERYRDKKAKDKGKSDDDATLPDSPAAILALPPAQRFKALCHLTLPQLRALREGLSPEDRPKLVAGFTPEQLEALAAFNGPERVISAEDVQVKLMRDIYSERQLEEVMVDFWLNHFNVYMRKNQQSPYFISSYVRQTIRPYALTNFTQLLEATATSPAMLEYLDNSESIGPHSEYATGLGNNGFRRGQQPQGKAASGLNENYAREVMELHTIGVNGGYTQKDVTEVAKVFTGWTVGKGYKRGGEDTVATFDASKHEPGDKMVLGHKIKSNGQAEGFEVLRMLASSPQCARFISTKLAVRFVSDAPPQAMIDRMTGTFIETHGDIRRVLLAMVNSPEFFTQGTYRAKVKTPQDFVVSAVRAAGSDVKSTAALTTAISDLGMPIYGMQTPNGYSMKSEAWNSTTALVSRMNFALALASNRVQGVKTDFSALLGADADTMTPEDKDKILEARLLHVPVSPRTQQLIVAQTSTDQDQQVAELRQVTAVGAGRGGKGGGGDPFAGAQAGRMGDPAMLDTQAALAAGLIFGSPEFQRR